MVDVQRDDYTPEETAELKKLDMRVMGLREQNQKLLQKLNQHGASIDISDARIRHFLGFLQSIGLITDLQLLQELESWELKYREQLKAVEVQFTEMLRAQGQAVRQESGLVIPGRNQRM